PLPCPATANRGPAVTWSYDASWCASEIASLSTYCRERNGRFVNRHSTAPSPCTCAGTLPEFDVAVVKTRPVSTSMIAIWNTRRAGRVGPRNVRVVAWRVLRPGVAQVFDGLDVAVATLAGAAAMALQVHRLIGERLDVDFVHVALGDLSRRPIGPDAPFLHPQD